jgi:hypothetical protein
MWTKHRFTRWQAGAFTITEEARDSGRPYRLNGPDDCPQHFESLSEAKDHAALQNELALFKADNEKLPAELAERRGQWPAAAPKLAAATAEH